MARKKKTESPRAVVADLPHGPFVAETPIDAPTQADVARAEEDARARQAARELVCNCGWRPTGAHLPGCPRAGLAAPPAALAPALDSTDVALAPEKAIERFDDALRDLRTYRSQNLVQPELLGPADAKALAAVVNLLERAVAATKGA